MKGDLESVIEQIYSAVGDSAQWEPVLHSVAEYVGAGSGCIVSNNAMASRGNVGCFHNIDPEWIRAYNQWYAAYDPTLALLEQQPGRVHVDHVTGPQLTGLQGDARLFYNEVMRPQDFRHTLHRGLSCRESRAASIVLQRSERQGAFSSQNVEALSRLAPHLERALLLHARCVTIDGVSQGLAAAMDRTHFGVVLLDGCGRIVHMNAIAGALLRQSRALQATRDGLVARRLHENRALQVLVNEALSPGRSCNATTLRLHTRDGWPCMYLQVAPLYLPIDGITDQSSQVRAAVWIGTNANNAVCPETLQALYGLTTAESRTLARLVEGYTQAAIARLRSVSDETIRSQVKSVMGKLGVSRQADLVRIVLCGPGGVLAEATQEEGAHTANGQAAVPDGSGLSGKVWPRR